MGETALNFGPDWIRALSTGSTSAPPPTSMPIPRYSLAEFRYGREEMLALIPKDIKMPNCLKQYPQLTKDNFQIPLALTPATEEEQRLWNRSVNSEQAFRASGKSGPGYSMHRTGRGGSVDRGRGRGRGGYYQRGLMHDDTEDGLPFSRPKPVERSLSASEKDHRWDDRDRRYDRTYAGRERGMDDSGLKQDVRGTNEYWRKVDKDDDGDWRTSGFRAADKAGSRGPWRSNSERDRRDMAEKTPPSRSSSGNIRSGSSSQPKQNNHSSWKDDNQGKLPEWSVEEASEPDTVGTFDSTGAFLETKVSANTSLDEIYASDDADEGIPKQDSPEANKEASKNAKKSFVSIKKQSSNKQSSKPPSDVKNTEEKQIPNPSEHTKSSSPKSKRTVGKSAENVIKQNTVVENQTIVETKSNAIPSVTESNVPTHVSEPAKVESVILSNVRNSESAITASGIVPDEDGFAYHQKATENMVAQWTEEIEEQRAPSQTDPIHPTHQEKDTKWFYQDPQGEIQGPFAPQEMLEWYNSGYFTSNLMIRRSCDENFSKLGDLIEAWGRIPFIPCNNAPPIRMPVSIGGPINQTIVPNPVLPPTPVQLPKPDEQLLVLQQQLFQQQIMQQQLMLRQAQIQQILAQLKQEDNFTNLNSQQQQQLVMQQFLAQQMPRPTMKPMTDKPNLMEAMNPLSLPHLGLPLPIIKPAWLPSAPGTAWPGPPGGSIWDVDMAKANAEMAEAEKLKLIEENEKKLKAEELKLQQEREAEEKKMEELRRQQEEARIIQELQKQEEERKRIEELQRQQEEERQRQEELKRLEEQKREEEERLRQEELRRLEEVRKQEEQRRLEELRKQEEQRKLEEKRRKEEEKRLEELKRKEEQRLQEELQKQQELRKLEEKRKKEEMQKKIQMEKEKERLLEIERQKEALRQKELEREERLRKEKERREKEEEDLRRLAELKIKSQGPVWGIQKNQTNVQLSLADIQKLQGEKDKEEREEKARLLFLQQQSAKQIQQVKNGLSWAKRANDSQQLVKSLTEIQQEEAERLAKLNKMQKPPAPVPTVNSNAGVWGNSSHLNKITAASATWNMNNASSTNNMVSSGFWDDALSSTQTRKPPSKTNTSESAFPALANPVQPAHVSSNKGKNVRAKKEEDAVARLFGSHHKPTDEFTKWCTEAISSMPSSVDVPTFVAFLKDIESPYEVYDYVKSYFGEGKEPREFAKQFLEKRSKYRNLAKQTSSEDNTLWGPAPAITPSVNKNIMSSSNDNDGTSNSKSKIKKKKGKMQKLDSSMLGFTVQSNPDRLNVGEMDHIENM